MVQAAKPKLDRGDVFPTVSCQLVDGSSLTLPQGLTGCWQVLIFYRGFW